jgi:dipeptidyl-peptidase-4
MAFPSEIHFSPDDRLIAYLHSPERSLTNQLFIFDPQSAQAQALHLQAAGTSESELTPAEALRRERQRQLTLGVTQYAWSPDGQSLLVPLNGDLYLCDPHGANQRKVFAGQGKPAIDPQFSPDSQWIAFVCGGELCVVSTAGDGEVHELTGGAQSSGCTYGLAEFVAQEEIGRSHGFWWSPDSQSLAFEEVDDTRIPVYRIMHQGQAELGETAQEDHHYPFAGQANVAWRLGVVARSGSQPVWMDCSGAEYLARAAWLPDGELAAQLENREQDQLELACFDPQTGEKRVLFVESQKPWINLNDLFHPLRDGRFLWGSERSGFQHLYLYTADGKLLHALTSGEWLVDSLAGVDEAAGLVYFMGNRDDPRDAQLYAVPLSGGDVNRITQEAGTHAVSLDHTFSLFVDTWHSLQQPPVTRLCRLADGKPLAALTDKADPRIQALGIRPPRPVELTNRVGTRLYGAIFSPPESSGAGPYPTLVYVYGGPHVQNVVNSWKLTATLRAQYLASLGFLVFVLDNRGSARRGLAFEGALHLNMGSVEIDDQVDGVRWLVAQGLADPQRVGIYGWSYGGFMAASCLMRAPDTFCAAVAGAPVSAWDGYDSHYTERYMATPQSNPQGYVTSGVLSHVDGLRGPLLLVHGLIDENVHFRHTARLINALIHARKPYELLVFPDERHTPRYIQDRVYMEERIRDFLLAQVAQRKA